MKNFKIALVSSAIVFAVAGNAHAAGATDSADTEVKIIKDDTIDLSKVDNIDLGTAASLATDTTGNDQVCVFASTGAYSVTATSANADGTDFRMANGGDFLGYDLAWGVGPAVIPTGATPLTPGIASGSLIADSVSPDCLGANNAWYQVSVAAADFNAAPTGTYVDTVTLTVTSL